MNCVKFVLYTSPDSSYYVVVDFRKIISFSNNEDTQKYREMMDIPVEELVFVFSSSKIV
jgi:hypothetical protein